MLKLKTAFDVTECNSQWKNKLQAPRLVSARLKKFIDSGLKIITQIEISKNIINYTYLFKQLSRVLVTLSSKISQQHIQYNMFTFVNIIDLQNLQIQINKKYIKDLCSKIPSIFCQIFNSVLKRKSTEILYDDMITLKKK